MIHFKSTFCECFISAVLYYSLVQATPNEIQEKPNQRTSECFDQMIKAFGIDTPQIDCVKKAIKEFNNGMYLESDVWRYYRSFMNEVVLLDSVPWPFNFCIDFTKNDKKKLIVCTKELRSNFGISLEKVLTDAIFVHRQRKEGEEYVEYIYEGSDEEYDANNSESDDENYRKNLSHDPETYTYNYLDRVAKDIQPNPLAILKTPREWCLHTFNRNKKNDSNMEGSSTQ